MNDITKRELEYLYEMMCTCRPIRNSKSADLHYSKFISFCSALYLADVIGTYEYNCYCEEARRILF